MACFLTIWVMRDLYHQPYKLVLESQEVLNPVNWSHDLKDRVKLPDQEAHNPTEMLLTKAANLHNPILNPIKAVLTRIWNI